MEVTEIIQSYHETLFQFGRELCAYFGYQAVVEIDVMHHIEHGELFYDIDRNKIKIAQVKASELCSLEPWMRA